MNALKYLSLPGILRKANKKDVDISSYLQGVQPNLRKDVDWRLLINGKRMRRALGGELLYQDTEFALALRAENIRFPFDCSLPFGGRIALLGFDIDSKDSMLIKQIQAARRVEEYHPKQWERMLVKCAIEFSRDSGFKRVGIQRAEDNRWYNSDSVKGRAKKKLQERFKMRYNVTAERSGFEFNKDAGFYVYGLS